MGCWHWHWKDGHVWAEPSVLSVGHRAADCGAGALCEASAGNVLVLHHFVWRVDWGQRLFAGGGGAGRAAVGRSVPWVRQAIENSDVGNADFG